MDFSVESELRRGSQTPGTERGRERDGGEGSGGEGRGEDIGNDAAAAEVVENDGEGGKENERGEADNDNDIKGNRRKLGAAGRVVDNGAREREQGDKDQGENEDGRQASDLNESGAPLLR